MIAVFDDFIQDKQLLEDIANDSSFFSDPGIYRYWKGWWTSEPKNVKQRLIEYIWKDNLPIKLDAQITPSTQGLNFLDDFHGAGGLSAASQVFPKGVTIYGRWTTFTPSAAGIICYFGK